MSEEPNEQVILEGLGVSPGIAIGPAYVFSRGSYDREQVAGIAVGEVAGELERFENAVSQSEKELNRIASVARGKIGERSAEIFQAQAMMLRDVALYDEVVRLISEEHHDAAYAVQVTVEEYRKRIASSNDAYLRDRSDDLVDLQERLQRNLRRGKIISRIIPNAVVVAEHLTAADVILFSRRDLLGCATSYGGPTSHVALIAGSLGVPSVFSLHEVTDVVNMGDTVILDGLNGLLIVRPDSATLERYQSRLNRYRRLRAELDSLIPKPAETIDGEHVYLMANVEVEEEFPIMKRNGAEGIGLFRTEVLFLSAGSFPPEEEQVAAYLRAVEETNPDPVTFRLFDLGGDKVMPMVHREHNPFLGWRGIRILLDRREILETQVRAILRASASGPAHILLPMVTKVREIRTFKEILHGVMEDLRREGADFDENIPVGVMVEVPSAALMIDDIADEVDFLSIGTNDLTQYLLAVDRGNDLVSHLYEEMHPAVLRIIHQIIQAAGRAHLDVTVCGEMAAHARAIPVLLGLGLRRFSVSPAYLLEVKRIIRAISTAEADELARTAIELHESEEVTELVDTWLRKNACDPTQLLDSLEGANGNMNRH